MKERADLIDSVLKRTVWFIIIIGAVTGGFAFYTNAITSGDEIIVGKICTDVEKNSKAIEGNVVAIKENIGSIRNLEVAASATTTALENMKETQKRVLDKLDDQDANLRWIIQHMKENNK